MIYGILKLGHFASTNLDSLKQKTTFWGEVVLGRYNLTRYYKAIHGGPHYGPIAPHQDYYYTFSSNIRDKCKCFGFQTLPNLGMC